MIGHDANPTYRRLQRKSNLTFIPLLITFFVGPLNPSTSRVLADGPVGRQTDHASSDLINALIRLGRFDDAEAVIGSVTSREADPLGDVAAKGAIESSKVLAARAFADGSFGDDAIENAAAPVTDLLESYPDHPRRWFLESQKIDVERQAVRFAVLTTAVSPSPSSKEAAATRLVRAASATLEMATAIAGQCTRLQTQRGTEQLGMLADLLRLEQELLIESVSMGLMQTDLFSSDPDVAPEPDGIAAATQAVDAADQALAKLPNESTARREIQRLKTEAILRSGDRARAASHFRTLADAYPKPLPPIMQALAIRIELANGGLEIANTLIDAYYGVDPDSAPVSVEMDLVKLQLMLATASKSSGANHDEIGRWIESIGRRNDAYAARRAEAISLARLRGDGTSGSGGTSAAVVAARGAIGCGVAIRPGQRKCWRLRQTPTPRPIEPSAMPSKRLRRMRPMTTPKAPLPSWRRQPPRIPRPPRRQRSIFKRCGCTPKPETENLLRI